MDRDARAMIDLVIAEFVDALRRYGGAEMLPTPFYPSIVVYPPHYGGR